MLAAQIFVTSGDCVIGDVDEFLTVLCEKDRVIYLLLMMSVCRSNAVIRAGVRDRIRRVAFLASFDRLPPSFQQYFRRPVVRFLGSEYMEVTLVP